MAILAPLQEQLSAAFGREIPEISLIAAAFAYILSGMSIAGNIPRSHQLHSCERKDAAVFVFSMKLSRNKIALFSTLVICAAALVICAVAISANENAVSLKAPDNAARVAFLERLGWQVISVPIEVAEVKIPAEFGDVYERYNQLQKAQGFDLSLYKLRRVKRYTYEITNYPGHEGVRANLLVYGDTIIGGDVSTTALNGFMHELTRRPSQEELKSSVYLDLD